MYLVVEVVVGSDWDKDIFYDCISIINLSLIDNWNWTIGIGIGQNSGFWDILRTFYILHSTDKR